MNEGPYSLIKYFPWNWSKNLGAWTLILKLLMRFRGWTCRERNIERSGLWVIYLAVYVFLQGKRWKITLKMYKHPLKYPKKSPTFIVLIKELTWKSLIKWTRPVSTIIFMRHGENHYSWSLLWRLGQWMSFGGTWHLNLCTARGV